MNLEYEVLNGDKEIAVVIETALGSSFTEWIPIITPVSEKYAIFLYNRAGYGKSKRAEDSRTPSEISRQLSELVSECIPDKKYILVGHSLGAIYAEKYVRDHPQNVIGLILLDPATTEENLYKYELSKREYNSAGIDKLKMIRWGYWIGRLGILRVLKCLFKKSTPFYYFAGYDRLQERNILQHMVQSKTYHAMRREYRSFQNQELIRAELRLREFPKIPLRIICHSPLKVIEEIEKFGGLSFAEAIKVERIWHKTMLKHSSRITQDYKIEIADNSSHYIHLTNPEVLYQKIDEIVGLKYLDTDGFSTK